MDRTHWILAVAKPRPHRPEITFENRALYDINRQIIAVATPDAKLFQAMADELGCLVDWYGDERGRQLASDADRIAYAESGDPAARERVGRAFAGVSIDARECTKQKPR